MGSVFSAYLLSIKKDKQIRYDITEAELKEAATKLIQVEEEKTTPEAIEEYATRLMAAIDRVKDIDMENTRDAGKIYGENHTFFVSAGETWGGGEDIGDSYQALADIVESGLDVMMGFDQQLP